MNLGHSALEKCQTDVDEICGDVHALKEMGNDAQAGIRKVEEVVMDIQVEVGKLVAKLDLVDQRSQKARDTKFLEKDIEKNRKDLQDQKEFIDDLAVRMEVSEQGVKELEKKFSSELQ